jgi:hypothetical protein
MREMFTDKDWHAASQTVQSTRSFAMLMIFSLTEMGVLLGLLPLLAGLARLAYGGAQ